MCSARRGGKMKRDRSTFHASSRRTDDDDNEQVCRAACQWVVIMHMFMCDVTQFKLLSDINIKHERTSLGRLKRPICRRHSRCQSVATCRSLTSTRAAPATSRPSSSSRRRRSGQSSSPARLLAATSLALEARQRPPRLPSSSAVLSLKRATTWRCLLHVRRLQ